MLHSLFSVPVYTQFYDELPERNVARLEKWNKYLVLKLLISIKLASQHVFRDNTHDLITIMLNFLPQGRPLKYGPIDRKRITNKTIMLQIITDMLAVPDNGISENETLGSDFYRDVMETILIYNEHHFEDTGIGKAGQKLSHSDVWKLGLMQEINAENPATYNRIGAVKQVIYMEFLKQQFGTDYPAFEKGVIDYSGLSSMKDIAMLFIDLELNFEKAVKNSVPLVVIAPKDIRYELLHKLELVIDASSGAVNAKLAQLFTSPFLKLKDDNLYLLGTSDFDLITTKSWDFYLLKNKLFKNVMPNVKSIHDLKAEWGKKYVESFLCLRILQSLEKTGLRVLPSDDNNLPDATIIVNEKDVFMIEIKSSALDNMIASTQDVEGFQNFIDINFATTKKGVPQLNRNMEYLAKNTETAFRIRNPAKKLRVYPVIIYTEAHLNKQGVNDYVNSAAPIVPVHVRDAFQSVAAVTMIPIGFLIENRRLLEQDRSLLRKLITEYHAYVRKMKSKYSAKGIPLDFFAAMSGFEVWCIGRYGMYQDDRMKIFDTFRHIYKIG